MVAHLVHRQATKVTAVSVQLGYARDTWQAAAVMHQRWTRMKAAAGVEEQEVRSLSEKGRRRVLVVGRRSSISVL